MTVSRVEKPIPANDDEAVMCHACRIRPYYDEVNDLAEAVLKTADTRREALSLLFAVRQQIFDMDTEEYTRWRNAE